MVARRKQHSSQRPVQQGPAVTASRPNKIGASTPYNFRGKADPRTTLHAPRAGAWIETAAWESTCRTANRVAPSSSGNAIDRQMAATSTPVNRRSETANRAAIGPKVDFNAICS